MTTAASIPQLLDHGYFLFQPVSKDGKALLFYADGTVRFGHICDRGPRGVIICAPALQLDGGGHSITTRDPILDPRPITVEPSILCADCGTHGWIRDSWWASA